MANRQHSARRIKRRRSYNVREAAKATGATHATVRNWSRDGLEPVKGVYPQIFRGVDIIEFFKQRADKRKQPCGPGRMFCLHCKEPKTPAFNEAEFRPDGTKLGTLTGLCPDCAGLMHRRASISKLDAAAGDLKVSIKRAESRLDETHDPNCNPHFERG